MRLSKTLSLILFLCILLTFSLWQQTSAAWSSFGKSKPPVEEYQDTALVKFLVDKTGVSLPTIHQVNAEKPFGMMAGIPGQPQMMLSKPLLETFTAEEKQYVALHEIGHYLRWHTAREILFTIAFGVMGWLIIGKTKKPASSLGNAVLWGVILGLLLVQNAHLQEYEADRFALSKLDQPEAMITATEKFRAANDHPYTEWWASLVYRGISYDARIKLAKEIIGS